MSFSNLDEFLTKHQLRSQKGAGAGKGTSTHTRIGDKKQIHGGNYAIPETSKDEFWELYHEKVFIQKRHEYLTECQMPEGGPILVDLDFRYDLLVTERQHSSEHIIDIIQMGYLEALKSLFVFDCDQTFDVYVLEKDTVNRVQEKGYTKDGIHLVIGIQMDHILQQILRTMVLAKVDEIWSLPITNTWESVFDEGISIGKTNWQIFGSRKPEHDAYALTQHWSITYDKTDGEFMIIQNAVSSFNMKENIHKLSAQYRGNCKFEIHKSVQAHYAMELEKMQTKKKRRTVGSSKIRMLAVDLAEDDDGECIPLNEISNKEILVREMDKILSELKVQEYFIRETHELTQILPPKYYEPGSHLINRGVAFALKNTDERLFLSWVMLRSKADDFEYDTIIDLFHQWSRYFKDGEGCVTRRSIMYWAKNDSKQEYDRILKNSIDFYIDLTLATGTDYDLAMVLYQKYKDKYVCSSLVHKVWYVFRNHRWEKDMGNSLRLEISRGMFEEYESRASVCLEALSKVSDTLGPEYDKLKAVNKFCSELKLRLKKTDSKNNIFREASEIFYDRNFENEMDANKNLMCFTNGVVDMKNKIFRPGNAQDYITKCTGIPYLPYDGVAWETELEEINLFMSQLFPDPQMTRYMWDHLSSVLIGENINQTFNIYRGSGSNGKSILTDLMSKTLGEYKGTVPITLVTEKRNCIGGTSSEVIQLKGIRYAVMQEPSKNDRLNEGVLKELTGGDPIQARALYAESCVFTPQFSLVVCTNIEFEISSNDDGTWRRIRMIDFKSKFVDEDEEQQLDHGDSIFPKDKSLKDKLPRWAPIFASVLIKRVFETGGFVEDCPAVMSSSKKYRQGQDTISQFVQEKIRVAKGKSLTKNSMLQQFKIWHQSSMDGKKQPKGSEVAEYIDKKFAQRKRGDVWLNLELIMDPIATVDILSEIVET